jgi:hypothetical protein
MGRNVSKKSAPSSAATPSTEPGMGWASAEAVSARPVESEFDEEPASEPSEPPPVGPVDVDEKGARTTAVFAAGVLESRLPFGR